MRPRFQIVFCHFKALSGVLYGWLVEKRGFCHEESDMFIIYM